MNCRLAVCLIFVGVVGVVGLSGQPAPGLFTEAVQPAAAAAAERHVVRRRWVTIDYERLRDTMRALAPGADTAPALSLNLFDDAVFIVTLVRVESTSGGFVWAGRIAALGNSPVTLAVTNDVMAGRITTPDAHFAIRYAGNGVHEISQIDQSVLPPEAPPVIPDTPPVADGPITAADDGSVIDILVVFTPSARIANGGSSAMSSLINLAIFDTNQAYADSGAIQRLRLAHSAEVDYTETYDMHTDLDRLRTAGDGYMDDVHALRDAYSADLVHLIENTLDNVCGTAYLLTGLSPGFASSAFGITDYTCITPNYSFAHETGHNMGLHHDIYVTGSATGAFPYSRGYVNQAAFAPGAPPTKRWRDIMAYNDQCADAGFTCSRLLNFSNPLIDHTEDPMGNASTADAVRTLNETRTTVANFRASPTTSISIDDVSSAEGSSGTATFTFTVALSAASSTSVTVNYATGDGTASGGSDYTAAAGSLSFPAGFTTQPIAVSITGDAMVEGAETFSVTLSSPSGATIADSTGVGTIRNDDFTDHPVSAGIVIKATHVAELRTMINEARMAAGLGAFEFTNPLTAGTTLIRAADITELRTALGEACSPPAYTDPTLIAGITPVRAVHINEIRAAVLACL